ncbi:MFS transporter [Brevibacillus choshinensis]|uniref:MFS transporter n=1 Tax=Brevibacillus choshinensis TaxID=54911 RepID=A0ABX7FQZ7_BRECH|nr:MFS transporter [Brevibacillus choshinensis]QRG68052.1 MFS transporter [Brevibacillus choshinensis]
MTRNAAVWLVTGATTLFVVGTDVFVVSPLLPSIAEEYGVTPAVAGWLVTAMSIMYACGSPLMGVLFDRYAKRRRLLLWGGLVLFCLANLWTGFAASFGMLLTSRAVAGLALAAIAPCVYAFVSDLAPPSRRAAWLSVVVSGNLTGLWAGTPLGTLIADQYGWRFTFWLIAVLSFILAWINLAIWPQRRHSSPAARGFAPSVTLMVRSVLVTVYWATAIYGVYTYLGTSLTEDIGFRPSQIAASLIAYGVGAMLGSLNGGNLADKFGAKAISSASLLTLTACLVCVGLFYQQGVWLFVLLFLWAFVGYAFVPSYQSRLALEYPDHLGRIMAWNITGMYIGMTIGSYVGGPVYQAWGFTVLACLCAGAALIAGLCSLRPAPKQKEAEQPLPFRF